MSRLVVWISIVIGAMFFLMGTMLDDGLTTHGLLLTLTYLLGEIVGVTTVYLIGRDR